MLVAVFIMSEQKAPILILHGSQRPYLSIVQGLTKIGRGLILNGEATVENVAQKVKEYVDSRIKGKINFNDYADDFAKEILVEVFVKMKSPRG